MSRILFLANHDLVIYNFRFELVKKLIEHGHEVFISCPNGDRIEELIKVGANFCETRIDRHGINPFKDLKLLLRYKRIIKNIKPDFVFSYTIKPNIYGAIAARKYNVPFIANITGLGAALEYPGLKQKICIHLYKHSFKSVRKVFFQNTENRDFFIKHKIINKNFDLLPGSGVNLSKFRPLPFPGGDMVCFAFIGRVMKEKGIDYYLKLASYIKSKYNNVEFHVCGFIEDEYKGILGEYSKNGIVFYHGMIKDVGAFLSKIECVVLPSYYPEGISNVLLESAASSRPIITTNRAGCRETVDDGVSGFCVECKNQLALNSAVEKYLSLNKQQRSEMGKMGRIKMEKGFDRNIVIKKYLKEIGDA